MANKLTCLGQEKKKSVCSLLIHWQSQLHIQVSALFKQRVSLKAAAIFCLC